MIASLSAATTLEHKSVQGSGSAPEGVDIDDFFFTFGLNYGIDERWSVGLSVPARLLEVERLSTGEQISSNGFGDIELRGTYRILKGILKSDGSATPELQASLGVSLPTGATNVRESSGNKAGDTFQPGRGTVDPLLSVSLLYPFRKRWRALGRVSARLGVHENDNDYEFGDAYNAAAGLSYSFERPDIFAQADRTRPRGRGRSAPSRPWIDIFAQADWTHLERDRRDGAGVTATGSDTLNIVPGLQYWATDALSLRLQDRILIAHDANGKQQLPEHLLTFAVVFQF